MGGLLQPTSLLLRPPPSHPPSSPHPQISEPAGSSWGDPCYPRVCHRPGQLYAVLLCTTTSPWHNGSGRAEDDDRASIACLLTRGLMVSVCCLLLFLPLPPGRHGEVLQEMSSAEWWEETEKMMDIPPGPPGPDKPTCLGPLIFFSDGSNIDKFGRLTAKPVMLGSGNLRNAAQRKDAARALVALIPELRPQKHQAGKVAVQRAKRFLHHQAMKLVLAPIVVCL